MQHMLTEKARNTKSDDGGPHQKEQQLYPI